jgi:hypothetical protein
MIRRTPHRGATGAPAEAIASLSEVRMSFRAIAKLLGAGVGTVHRSLTQMSAVPNGTADDETTTGKTLGTDGKEYPRRRKTVEGICSLCGDSHPADIEDCPWDRYAQGAGPHPETGVDTFGSEDDGSSPEQSGPAGFGDNDPERRPKAKQINPRPRARPKGGSNLAIQAIEAMQSIAGQVWTLPDLLTDVERVIESNEIVAQSDLLSLRLRQLDISSEQEWKAGGASSSAFELSSGPFPSQALSAERLATSDHHRWVVPNPH